MSIRNYTSEVPAERSIMDIEKILVGMGAGHISKEYKNGEITAISFSVIVKCADRDCVIPFMLPAKTESIKKYFLRKNHNPTPAQDRNADKQSRRTAWKNIKEWVELQATMIKLEQVEFMEVFLPYIYFLDDGKTLFERMKSNNFKQLSS
jgi:hypothetical protein